MKDIVKVLIRTFEDTFAETPLVVQSPGRINLLGEHTDYNNGYVMPAAIDLCNYVALQKRNDKELHFISIDYNDTYSCSIDNLERSGKLWPDYMLGVIEELLKQGHELGGVNVAVTGDIPTGAGLSSSAALECAFAFGLDQIFNLGLERLSIVKTAQSAENNYVGVKCGIMDQFASVFGHEDQVMRLDCRDLSFEYIPFTSSGISILLFNTGVKHSLASSAYNQRREECQAGVDLIKAHYPEVSSLREVNEQMLTDYVLPVDKTVYQRCLYVVSENTRLIEAGKDLQEHNMKAFGQKMFATHYGLQHLYEVSCAELDYLVDFVKEDSRVLGARMMGGGFGGCTINLIATDAVADITAKITELYKDKTGLDLEVYQIKIGEGTSLVDVKNENINQHAAY